MRVALVMALLGGALVGPPPGPASALTRVVDPSQTCGASGPVYCTIQQAVDDASSGDTIQIAAGTHVSSEAAVVSVPGKDLTFIGAGQDETIIDGENTRRGILVTGSATYEIRDLTIINGFSTGSGAGLSFWDRGEARVIDVTIRDSTAGEAGGGILAQDAVVLLERATVIDNTATVSGGGGIAVRHQPALVEGDPGEEVGGYGGSLTIVDSTISGNTAVVGGGLLVCCSNFDVEITGSVFEGNSAEEHGGAIVFQSIISGGITIFATEVVGNHTTLDGGGGGLYVGAASPLLIDASLFGGNTAKGHGGGVNAGQVGSGELVVRNSTFSGNSAEGDGGGLYGRPLIESSTFTGNHATGRGGGVAHDDFAALQMRNSIVSGNTAGDSNPDCLGGVSLGYNLIGTAEGTCFPEVDPTTLYGEDPLLGALADNGGPTETHAIDTTSPAFNAGNPAVPGAGGDACHPVDQRLEPRGLDQCDIGAYEVQIAGSVSGTVIRLAGANRYATATAVSEHHHPDGTPVVFVATGSNFPDALAGAAAAGADGASLLLSASLPPATATELTRLDPSDLVILGGPAAVSAATEAALASYGTVERLAGANRYATAVEISKHAFPVAGSASVVVVATGENFADALAGAPAAVALGGPVLLTMPGSLPAVVAAEIQRLDPDEIIVLGGTAAVSASVFAELDAIAPATRIAGANRYETAVKISEHAFPGPSSVQRVYVAVGTNFPDALAGAAAAAANGAPVLLTQTNSLPAGVGDEISRLGPNRIYILGGLAVISQAVENVLAGLL